MDELKENILNHINSSREEVNRSHYNALLLIEDIESHCIEYAPLPSPCTPEQYKEITGKDYPDDGLVWVKPRGGWVPVTYGLSKDYPFNYKPVAIAQTGQPSPPSDWRPE